ncbi:MAG: YciI family protein [Candidatus Eremiobacteraeota bacterium]|nr:YciI family protein [Candidatus Eremiobacteraeota bacterium]
MKFVCLIYDPTPEAGYQEAYGRLVDEALKSGVMRGGDELTPPAGARTLRVRNGKRTLSNGSFPEANAALNGYMIFECASLDEATEWAAKIPGARTGSVEIRPAVQNTVENSGP